MRRSILILPVFLLCLILVGCRGGQAPQQPLVTKPSTEKTEPVTYGEITAWVPPEPEAVEGGLYRVILNDYERPADFSPMQARRNMTVTVEKQTVHSGKQSARLICKKDYKSYAEVSVAQPLNLDHRGNFSNFSTVKKISFWVYNAQDKEMDLTTLLKLADDGEYTKVTSVPPQEWYLVEIPIDSAKLSNPKGVRYMTFSFQPLNVTSDTVFYVDDLCLYRTGK